jgi:hypothetical protein
LFFQARDASGGQGVKREAGKKREVGKLCGKNYNPRLEIANVFIYNIYHAY